jgi:ornithine cyclodeaminase/alanine dehydrogenase-like protein (mu-crystallin family)
MTAEDVSEQLPWFSKDAVESLVSISAAIAAVTDELRRGHDPANDPPRTIVDAAHGQLLLMPAESGHFLGIKIAGVAPKNPSRGLPRIQATYLLMDSESMTPVALMDGSALTLLRTPAVSAVAASHLARKGAANLLVFGSGPQARAHIDAMRAIRPITNVSIVATSQPKGQALAQYVLRLGLESQAIDASIARQVKQAVEAADVIVCATTSTTPLFDGRHVSTETCIIAVGSHEPTARELDGALVGRALVVVEDRATALRESGDVAMAIAEGNLDPSSLVSLLELVTKPTEFTNPGRPAIFKSSGMAWEDLAVAAEVFRRSSANR